MNRAENGKRIWPGCSGHGAGLDELGRAAQQILVLADGSFDTLDFWSGLPERVVLTVRNRALYWLPEQHTVSGCIKASDLAEMRDFPARQVGKRKPRWKHRKPSFYLVSAHLVDGQPQLTLAWLWQRWELEVAHREMKSSFGVGEKQCWTPASTIDSLMAGCKTLVFQYSLATISRRTVGFPQFQALWARTPDNWLKKEAFLSALSNSAALNTRIQTKKGAFAPFFVFAFIAHFAQRAKVEGGIAFLGNRQG